MVCCRSPSMIMFVLGCVLSAVCVISLTAFLSVFDCVVFLLLLVLWKPRWYPYMAMASVGGVCLWLRMCACRRPVSSCMGG